MTITDLGNGLRLHTMAVGESGREQVRRWAVVGPAGATSVSAVVMPAAFAPAHASIYVAGASGEWLLPSDQAVHSPTARGDFWQEAECDLLPEQRCWCKSEVSGAERALRAWADAGHDDGVLARYLEALYAEELLSP